MDIPRKIEKRVCATCGGYTFRRRPIGTWAFCTAWGKWAEEDPERPPIGERTCERYFIEGGSDAPETGNQSTGA